MSYGLQVFDGGGGLLFDSNAFTCRMVYRVAFQTSTSQQTIVIPGFDPAKGVVWLDTTWAGSGTTFAQRFTVSGSTVTILPSYFSTNQTDYLNAVMFS
ncbi:hypothetical protein [Pseudomonas sp. PDM20]|uniref:hypothetical protein n=1 Tax=Pseudomonas sp. PDM20 TaxID=2769254 RepID=UPI001783DD30|nr:hypothetical protein [Pseudomonas sp. PDM20]MBD9685249.1 hypothetical protein [Pseudomonas sp. PDM20]